MVTLQYWVAVYVVHRIVEMDTPEYTPSHDWESFPDTLRMAPVAGTTREKMDSRARLKEAMEPETTDLIADCIRGLA